MSLFGNNLSDAEKCFIIHGIQDDFRTDGRSCDNYRTIELAVNVLTNTHGSSKVRLGNTELLVGVKVELGKPEKATPDEGRIEFHVDCSPNATPAAQRKAANKDFVNNIESMLVRTYANKIAIDLTSLCIIKGKMCWIVHVDVLILECGGNILDCTSLGVKSALQDTGIPRVVVKSGDEGEEEVELPDDPFDVQHISVNNVPILVTVSFVGTRHIIDATVEEESCCSASVVMGVTRRGRILGVRKQCGGSLNPETLVEMLEFGKKSGRQLHVALDKMLKSYEKGTTGYL
uniref:Ribosomal RNA-processing protein 42 n=1 Tax=Phallusia mammillata TaxID=59560 RepID=A0A6F9DBN9_9ASCI|nr:exosome complex component RRP42-like [Phallusia mammillata]